MIGRQILISYLPKLSMFIVTPILVKILTNNLTIGEYGSYSLINSLGNYLFFIAGFGIPKFLGKEIPGKEEKVQYRLFNTYTVVEIFIYLIFFVVIGIFNKYLTTLLNLTQYSNVILFFLFGYIFYVLYNELLRFYGLQKRLELKSLLALLDKPLILLTIFFLLFLFKSFTINNIFQFYVVVFIMLFLLSFIFYKKKFIRLVDLKQIKKFPNIILFLWSYFLIDLFFKTKDILPRYFLSGFYNNELVGLYSFADNYARLIFILTNSFIFIFYPYIAEAYNNFTNNIDIKRNKEDFYKYLRISLNFSVFIFTFGCFIAYLFKKEFILLLGNNQYLKTENILVFFFCNYFLLLLISIIQPIFILSKKRTIIKRIYLPLLIFNILISFFSIKYLSLKGAVYGILITNFILCSVFFFSLRKLIKNFLFINDILKFLIFIAYLIIITHILYKLDFSFLLALIIFLSTGIILLLYFLREEINTIFVFKTRG